jgi:hypothetical protein
MLTDPLYYLLGNGVNAIHIAYLILAGLALTTCLVARWRHAPTVPRLAFFASVALGLAALGSYLLDSGTYAYIGFGVNHGYYPPSLYIFGTALACAAAIPMYVCARGLWNATKANSLPIVYVCVTLFGAFGLVASDAVWEISFMANYPTADLLSVWATSVLEWVVLIGFVALAATYAIRLVRRLWNQNFLHIGGARVPEHERGLSEATHSA